MRRAWIIAWRGFVEHATSRPFLLGVMLPLFYLLLVGYVPNASQSQLALLGGTVRDFAVIDETGSMLPVIDAALEFDDQTRSNYALFEYVEKYADADRLRAGNPGLARELLDGDPDSQASVQALVARGGATQTFIALRPYLKPGARPFIEPSPRFRRLDVPEDIRMAKDLPAAALPYLSGKVLIPDASGPAQLWAILVIPKGIFDGSAQVTYMSDDLTRPGLREFLRVAIDQELKRRKATETPLDARQVNDILTASSQITSLDPDPEHLSAVTGIRQLRVLGANVVYFMLFFALFMTANMVVMALVEEKSNRVAELLLSCVRAETLMAGKLFTGLFLAMFLVTVWVVTVSTTVTVFFPAAAPVVNELLDNVSDPGQVFQIGVFFALSYLTVGAFFLAAGSAANSISDAQAVVAPATLITMPICMMPLAVAYAPDSIFARFMSYVPFFSPFTMMVRSLSAPEGIDVLGSLVVSGLTLWWLIRLVARVFRTNLLRPDAPATFTGFLRDLFGPRRSA